MSIDASGDEKHLDQLSHHSDDSNQDSLIEHNDAKPKRRRRQKNPENANATLDQDYLAFEPSSVWLRIIVASIIMAATGGVAWGFSSIKPDLLRLKVFGSRCRDGVVPCDDQELTLNLMYQITVCGSQALSALSGIYFQLFKRRVYTLTCGLLFAFGVCGFGVGLLVKDVPGISDFLFFVCYLSIGFSGIATLLGCLSYVRDVSQKGRSLAGALINAPFDTSSLVFFFFSLVSNGFGVPLWVMCIVYGLVFGAVLVVFSIFMEPKRRKLPLEQQIADIEDNDAPEEMTEVQVTHSHSLDERDAPHRRKGQLYHTLTHSLDEELLSEDDVSPTQLDDFPVTDHVHHHEVMEPPHPGAIPLALPDIQTIHSEILESTADISTLHQSNLPEIVEMITDVPSEVLDPQNMPPPNPKSPFKTRNVSRLMFILSMMDLRKVIPFRKLITPECIIFHIIQSLIVAQCNFFQATVIEQARWVTGSSEEALKLNTVFNVMLPILGTVISVVLGPFLTYFHPVVGILGMLVGWILWNILSLLQVAWLQYFTYFAFISVRALFYIEASAVVYSSYPASEATIIYSSIVTASGSFAVGAAYLANYLAVHLFHGSFFVVNLVFGIISTFFFITYAFAAYSMDRKVKLAEKKRQQELEEQNGLTSSGSDSSGEESDGMQRKAKGIEMRHEPSVTADAA